MNKPTVVVVNGTAGEGYWAVYYLLKTGLFHVKATARRPESELARKLAALDIDGNRCEVVRASNDNEEELIDAFAGAQGIYGTSVYNIYAKPYRPANPLERAQCHAVINAAARTAGLEHFVWQTMTRFEIPPEELGLEAPIHFETKWRFEDVVRDKGLPWTFLRQPAYMRQMKFGMQFKNRLVYPYQPDTRIAYVAEEDLGKFVAAIFSQRDKHLHKAVNGVSEVVTPVDIAARAHALNPAFSPRYRVATKLENAIFDYIIVGLNPAFRYPLQINRNLMAGNYFAMTEKDRAYCLELAGENGLSKLEDWMQEFFRAKGWMPAA